MRTLKVYQLLNAQKAIEKISDSGDTSPSFRWDFADFLDEFGKELVKFEKVRRKMVEANTTISIDDEGNEVKDLNEQKYNKELNEILMKDVDLPSVSKEEVKKVSALTASDIIGLKSFLE